jgi:hypothetical protein
LTHGVHNTVSAVHDGVLDVLDGAADAVLGVPDSVLGVHCVVCFSVAVSAQDIVARL